MTYYLAIYFCASMVGLEPVCTDNDPYFMRNPVTGRKEVYSTKDSCKGARLAVKAYWGDALKITNQDRTTVRGKCVEVKQ